MILRSVLMMSLGTLCLLAGLAFVLTPIPLGLPLISAALAIFIASNRPAARLMLLGRLRLPLLDRSMDWLERYGGRRVRRALRRTRPGRVPRRLVQVRPRPAMIPPLVPRPIPVMARLRRR